MFKKQVDIYIYIYIYCLCFATTSTETSPVVRYTLGEGIHQSLAFTSICVKRPSIEE